MSGAKLKTDGSEGHTLLFTGSNDPSLYVKVPSGNYYGYGIQGWACCQKGHGEFGTWSQYG